MSNVPPDGMDPWTIFLYNLVYLFDIIRLQICTDACETRCLSASQGFSGCTQIGPKKARSTVGD